MSRRIRTLVSLRVDFHAAEYDKNARRKKPIEPKIALARIKGQQQQSPPLRLSDVGRFQDYIAYSTRNIWSRQGVLNFRQDFRAEFVITRRMGFAFSRRTWLNRLCWALNLLTLYREILPRVYYILEDLRSDKTRGTDLPPWMTSSTKDDGRPSHDRIPSPAIGSFEQETQPDFQAAMHGEAGFDTTVPATSAAPIGATGTAAPRVVAAPSASTAESGEDPTSEDKECSGNSGLQCIAKKIQSFFSDEDIVEEFGPPTEWLWE